MDDDLTSWLSDISSRDEFLKTAPKPTRTGANLPPVRGQPAVVEVPQPTKPAAAAAEPPVVIDDSAIWDESELPSMPAAAPTAPAKAPPAKPPTKAADAPIKPRQRKHAYEYFNQWDAYDVDKEVAKLEDPPESTPAEAALADAEKNDGLPGDLTPSLLARMPLVEVERRALDEKVKGNEFYKAGDYKVRAAAAAAVPSRAALSSHPHAPRPPKRYGAACLGRSASRRA